MDQDCESIKFTCPLVPKTGMRQPNILAVVKNVFIFISKPEDVRMNGDFPETVEKLLNQWYPEQKDIFRPIHQLDYATSGVLCSALTKESASAGAFAFQNRKAKKKYVAILSGRIDFEGLQRTHHGPWSNGTQPPKEEWWVNEESFKKKHTPRKRSADQTHSNNQLGETWQDRALIESLKGHMTAMHKTISTASASTGEFTEELLSLSEFTMADFLKDKRKRKRLRKVLKSAGVLIEQTTPSEAKYFEVATSLSAPISSGTSEIVDKVTDLRDADQQEEYQAIATMIGDEGDQLIRIRIPIAPTDGFPMQVGGNSFGQYADTVLQICGYGSLCGMPVTKVNLYPLTGRRHQLRVHTSELGYPIIGDATYSPSSTLGRDHSRMMLHALSLQLELDEKKMRKIKVDLPSTIHVEDDDPFKFGRYPGLIR